MCTPHSVWARRMRNDTGVSMRASCGGGQRRREHSGDVAELASRGRIVGMVCGWMVWLTVPAKQQGLGQEGWRRLAGGRGMQVDGSPSSRKRGGVDLASCSARGLAAIRRRPPPGSPPYGFVFGKSPSSSLVLWIYFGDCPPWLLRSLPGVFVCGRERGHGQEVTRVHRGCKGGCGGLGV